MKEIPFWGCLALVLVFFVLIGGFTWGYNSARQPGHLLSDETLNNLKCLGAVVGTIALITLGQFFNVASQLVGGYREGRSAAGIQERVEQDVKVLSSLTGAHAKHAGMVSQENSRLWRLLGSQKPPELQAPEPQYGLHFDDSQFSELDDYINGDVIDSE